MSCTKHRYATNSSHADPCHMYGRTVIHFSGGFCLIQRPRLAYERFRQFATTRARSFGGRRLQVLGRRLGDEMRWWCGRRRLPIGHRLEVRHGHDFDVEFMTCGIIPCLSKCRLDPSVLCHVDRSSPWLVDHRDVDISTQQNRRGVLVAMLCLPQFTQFNYLSLYAINNRRQK